LISLDPLGNILNQQFFGDKFCCWHIYVESLLKEIQIGIYIYCLICISN
jgi:hypothetical protein